MSEISDAWDDLNRRAAAVPGGVPWAGGMRLASGDYTAAWHREGEPPNVVLAPGYIDTAEWDDEERREWVPDLSHAGTRGILRAALGSPAPDYTQEDHDRHVCEFFSRRLGTHVAGFGSTREQAEAAALVELAETRTEWGPG